MFRSTCLQMVVIVCAGMCGELLFAGDSMIIPRDANANNAFAPGGTGSMGAGGMIYQSNGGSGAADMTAADAYGASAVGKDVSRRTIVRPPVYNSPTPGSSGANNRSGSVYGGVVAPRSNNNGSGIWMTPGSIVIRTAPTRAVYKKAPKIYTAPKTSSAPAAPSVSIKPRESKGSADKKVVVPAPKPQTGSRTADVGITPKLTSSQAAHTKQMQSKTKTAATNNTSNLQTPGTLYPWNYYDYIYPMALYWNDYHRNALLQNLYAQYYRYGYNSGFQNGYYTGFYAGSLYASIYGGMGLGLYGPGYMGPYSPAYLGAYGMNRFGPYRAGYMSPYYNMYPWQPWGPYGSYFSINWDGSNYAINIGGGGYELYYSLPLGYMTVMGNGTPYYFYEDTGAFYQRQTINGKTAYRLCAAPLGVEIARLPAGAHKTLRDGKTFYVKNSNYFTARQEGGKTVYQVAAPPHGAILPALPGGKLNTLITKDATYYVQNGVYFLPKKVNGKEFYEVASKPN
ncbi:MAG: hypothetical protein NTX50_24385 [Candidatus Sumerlaeota bacterium]|nr:hypothetical protein [Candidatus Sumerlaeota bacterium]